jgi:transposase-like protein
MGAPTRSLTGARIETSRSRHIPRLHVVRPLTGARIEVVLKIGGVNHWLWRAVDQAGVVLDVLVQRRRDKQAAKRMLRKLLKKQMRPPRVMITDKLASYGAAKREVMPGIEHRQHRG